MVNSALVILSLVLSAFGQQFISAPVITNNVDATYTATLFNRPDSTIRGSVTASSGPNGVGLSFRVSFTGLPPDIGPFPYHVHIFRVPADGNCEATGEHLDPYNRTEEPPCDPSAPATCQVGDLAGKHGNATAPTFSESYTDLYLSNNAQSNAFVGNRSIVIHAANGTRLNCGNFELVSGPSSSAKVTTPGKTSTPARVPTISTSPHVPTFTSTPVTSKPTTTLTVSPPSTSTHTILTTTSTPVPIFNTTRVPTTSTSTHTVFTTTSPRAPTTFTTSRATNITLPSPPPPPPPATNITVPRPGVTRRF